MAESYITGNASIELHIRVRASRHDGYAALHGQAVAQRHLPFPRGSDAVFVNNFDTVAENRVSSDEGSLKQTGGQLDIVSGSFVGPPAIQRNRVKPDTVQRTWPGPKGR